MSDIAMREDRYWRPTGKSLRTCDVDEVCGTECQLQTDVLAFELGKRIGRGTSQRASAYETLEHFKYV